MRQLAEALLWSTYSRVSHSTLVLCMRKGATVEVYVLLGDVDVCLRFHDT